MIISTLIVIGVIFVGAVIYGVVTVPFSTIGTRGTNDIPVAFAPDEVDEFMTALVMSWKQPRACLIPPRIVNMFLPNNL